MLIEVRCPEDGKLFFELMEACEGPFEVVIKCRGRCHQKWALTWIPGKNVSMQVLPPPSS